MRRGAIRNASLRQRSWPTPSRLRLSANAHTKSPHRRRNSADYFNWWSLNRPERVSLSLQSSGTSTAFLTATSPALLKNWKHLVCFPQETRTSEDERTGFH